MSAMIDEPEAAPPAPDVAAMRDYNFRVLCASGTWRDFSFQVQDFLAARKRLAELIEAN